MKRPSIRFRGRAETEKSGREARRRAIRRLFMETLERRLPLTSVANLSPGANSHEAFVSASLAATFDQDIDGRTASPQTFAVHSMQRGQLTATNATITAEGPTVTVNPDSDLFAGEQVQSTATATIASASGQPVDPHVWRFRTAVRAGTGQFVPTGQGLGNHTSLDVALGDLDGDGDLDAFVANVGAVGEGNRVWLNEGDEFVDSGQILGNFRSFGVSLGDLDGDGDLDAFVANGGFGEGNRIWLNDGGVFTDSGQSLGNQTSVDVELGDVDGDGDLDAFVVNGGFLPPGNRVWLNDGGVFANNGQTLGDHISYGVALGDLDSDGDLDAFVANVYLGNRVWLNDGGLFHDSGQDLGNHTSHAVSLGDLDGDGDLDAFVANREVNHVWFNDDGKGKFEKQQSLGDHRSFDVSLGDLDADGDLDAFVANYIAGNRVWRNDGGEFRDSQQSLGVHASSGMSLGDVDGDGDLDAFTVNSQYGEVNRVWINQNPPKPSVELRVNRATIAEATGIATFTASLSNTTTVPVTVDLNFSGTATVDEDYTASATRIVISPGATEATLTVTAVPDGLDESDETVVIEIINLVNGEEGGSQLASTTIIDDDQVPASFRLSSFSPTSGGFIAQLSAPIDESVLNLGDTLEGLNGPADATVVGATEGPVAGSLVVSPGGRQIEFLATGDRLVADTYTVTLRSADNGIRDSSGNLLDGNGDGAAGDDFHDTFTAVTNTAEIGVQDFVRGPGQELNLPANSNNGLPITISDGTAVRSAIFTIDYNPDLLAITEVAPGAAMPAGSIAAVDTSTPGRAVVTLTSPTDLPAGPNTLINLQANVPTADAANIYGDQHVLDIHSINLINAAESQLPSIDNDGLHVAAFFSDVTRNGHVNASDATQISGIAASLASAFANFLTTDFMILSDVNESGQLNLNDAADAARFAVLLPVDTIPPIPGGVVIAAGSDDSKTLLGLAPPGLALALPAGTTGQDTSNKLGVGVPFTVGTAVSATSIHRPAVDTSTTNTTDRVMEEMDDEKFPLALEDAVQALLSASQVPHKD